MSILSPFLFVMLASSEISDGQTTIIGTAETKNGKEISEKMVLPSDDTYAPFPNVVQESPSEPTKTPSVNVQHQNEPSKKVDEWSEQNPKPFSISPQKQESEIENTLYEGGDRIYDVQSYPIKDIQTITEPNIDPTITNYPAY